MVPPIRAWIASGGGPGTVCRARPKRIFGLGYFENLLKARENAAARPAARVSDHSDDTVRDMKDSEPRSSAER
jgi:hypothetical protein